MFDLFYKRKAISRGVCNHFLDKSEGHWLHSELYEFCLNEGYADKNLIAKWKKVLSIQRFDVANVTSFYF